MFHDTYASVTLDGSAEQRVTGTLLGLSTTQLPPPSDGHATFARKLSDADRIEGYSPADPAGSLYREFAASRCWHCLRWRTTSRIWS